MLKTYRNDYDFAIVIGSYVVRPGDTIELVGYNGSMLTPVLAEESVIEEPAVEEKPKRAKKAAAEPEAE
jgi:hypothetical protein|nr:MAG TPA: hypothetical protein [Caudoviricetes sp.]